MFRIVGMVVSLFLVALIISRAAAQATPPEITPTPTPELSTLFTLPPAVTTGTPEPGQDVVLIRTITLDQVSWLILLFTVLVLLWIGFAVALVRRWI